MTSENFGVSVFESEGDFDECAAGQKILDAYREFTRVFMNNCFWYPKNPERKPAFERMVTKVGNLLSKFKWQLQNQLSHEGDWANCEYNTDIRN